MNAWEPIAPARDEAEWVGDGADAPFVVTRPPPGAPRSPLVFASPHSGRIYPRGMMAASRLDDRAIRRSEDAYVDRLIERAPAHGATVIAARFARVYVDVNREAWELDPAMFEDELPAYARGRSARVAAGLGAIARIVREGEEIYARKLTFAEARGRVEAVHRPYHEALRALVEEVKDAHGVCDPHRLAFHAGGRGPAGGGGGRLRHGAGRPLRRVLLAGDIAPGGERT